MPRNSVNRVAALLQQLDTDHGLLGMGESLSQMWEKGS